MQFFKFNEDQELLRKSVREFVETEALLSAIPQPKLNKGKDKIILKGELTSPINLKPGCRFAPRCHYAKEKCSQVTPEQIEIETGRYVACHYAGEI